MIAKYVPRDAESWVSELLHDVPAVMMVGPRACGKTTMALRHAKTVLRLDRPEVAAAMAADPEGVLRDAIAESPILVDEWQLVPSCLAAAKRLIDADDLPGCFLFTGSAMDEIGPHAWPATGRFVRVPVWGLTRREIETGRRAGTFFDRVATDGFNGEFPLPSIARRPNTTGYIERALQSGFPQALKRSSERTRVAWLNSYIDHLVARDAALIAEVRDTSKLRRYLKVLAASTAGIPTLVTLLDASGLNRETAQRYDQLLERLFVVEQVPAWSSNRLNRLSMLPKRYVCDSALAAALVGADLRTILRDGDLLGRVMDTFVAAQLRPELTFGVSPVTMHHLRQDGRKEVDLLLERADGAVIAIEIKAATTVASHDARHVCWLRDQLGTDMFKAGIVFYTGTHPLQLDERIWAVPICTLWA